MQRAEHRGFGQLLAQLVLDLARRQHAASLQQLPDMGDERRDAIGARCPRCALPIAVAAQRVDKGQCLGAHQKIRVIARRAEQVERERRIALNQPRQQVLRTLNRRSRRRRVGLTQASFDERGSWCRNLRLARQKKAEAGLGKPRLRVVQSDERLGLLPPERRARRQ